LEIKERKLGPKCRYVTVKEVGVATEELPPEKSSQFCLSDDEAREIGRLGKLLEEHFGRPQDVEWVVEEGVPLPESIVILQTRPEIIAKTKPPVDKIVDLMLDRISKGTGFEGLDM
jgi:pyruvate,water dikinase